MPVACPPSLRRRCVSAVRKRGKAGKPGLPAFAIGGRSKGMACHDASQLVIVRPALAARPATPLRRPRHTPSMPTLHRATGRGNAVSLGLNPPLSLIAPRMHLSFPIPDGSGPPTTRSMPSLKGDPIAGSGVGVWPEINSARTVPTFPHHSSKIPDFRPFRSDLPEHHPCSGKSERGIYAQQTYHHFVVCLQ